MVSCAMELVQWEMDQSSDLRHKCLCLRWLRKLARQSGRLPLSFYLRNLRIESEQIGGGGYSDIYTGSFGGWPVCFKVLRIFQGAERRQRVLKEFCHETLVWRQLHHPNVLPFLGVTETLFPGRFCLVSPYMKNGNAISYLAANPSHDRLSFVLDIANGLDYLHTFMPPIIHGDIRCSNVLVQENLTCCLADFGLALVSESQPLTTSSGTAPKASTRWCAPEIFCPSSFPNALKEKRDVYAFACTVLEMYTGKPPFSHITTEYQVMLEIHEGRRPLPPPGHLLPSELFTLVERCWSHTPSDRMSINAVITYLTRTYNHPADSQIRCRRRNSPTLQPLRHRLFRRSMYFCNHSIAGFFF
ncbi:kinase-like domain-containing protein [Flagelloscypha sp. PMI_526]|nr:kinase-like domain-containing protein [Flagelloscypha sp. PMI_526]